MWVTFQRVEAKSSSLKFFPLKTAFKKAFPCIRNPEYNKKYNTETAFSAKRMRDSILLAVMLTTKAYFFKICNNKYDDVSVDLILRCHLLSLKQLVSVLNVNVIKSEDFQPPVKNILQTFLSVPYAIHQAKFKNIVINIFTRQ